MSPFLSLVERNPDFKMYCFKLACNFAPVTAHECMAERSAAILDPLGEEWLEAELARWRQWGLLPEPDETRTDWVGPLWESPLFQGLLGSVSFYPGPEDQMADHLPTPCYAVEQFVRRRWGYMDHLTSGRMGRGEVKYWQCVLHVQAPELYLDPYLPPRDSYFGCDLACGWGRISLGLRNYANKRVLACDLAQPSLDHLNRMAAYMNLSDRVKGERHDIFALPLESDSTDFFLAFDIFEHMPTPLVIRTLQELLRLGRVGTLLYAEIPLLSKSLVLSHYQNWSAREVIRLFTAQEREGKRWELAFHHPRAPEHFSFRIAAAP